MGVSACNNLRYINNSLSRKNCGDGFHFGDAGGQHCRALLPGSLCWAGWAAAGATRRGSKLFSWCFFILVFQSWEMGSELLISVCEFNQHRHIFKGAVLWQILRITPQKAAVWMPSFAGQYVYLLELLNPHFAHQHHLLPCCPTVDQNHRTGRIVPLWQRITGIPSNIGPHFQTWISCSIITEALLLPRKYVLWLTGLKTLWLAFSKHGFFKLKHLTFLRHLLSFLQFGTCCSSVAYLSSLRHCRLTNLNHERKSRK